MSNFNPFIIHIILFVPAFLFSFYLIIRYGFKQMKIPLFTTLIGVFLFYVTVTPFLNFLFWVVS